MKTKTIQAAVARGAGSPWIIESLELDGPREDEILVRMVGTGMCHTDIVCKAGAIPVPTPMVLGHEGAGVVEAIGASVSKIKVGDHVVLSFDSCGHCRNCRKHNPGYCPEFFPRNMGGVRIADGSTMMRGESGVVHSTFFGQSSFATHALSRAVNAVVIDKALPLEIMGPLGCGIQTGAGAIINSLNVSAGDSLVIFGAGAVGLSALLAACVVDAGTVIVVEPNENRVRLALELGATHAINPCETSDVLAKIREITSGAGVNFTFDTTGIPAVALVAIEALAPGGLCGMVGAPPPDAMLPAGMMSMLMRGIGVKYIIEGDSDPQTFIPQMASWFQTGKFPFDKLITKFKFAEINEAAHASEKGGAIKPVLIF